MISILCKASITWSPTQITLSYSSSTYKRIKCNNFLVICLHCWNRSSTGVRSMHFVCCGIPSSLYTALLIADVSQLNEWMVDLSPEVGGRTVKECC